MKIEPFYFRDLAYVKSKVPSFILKELKQEAKNILENPNQYKKWNKKLAGNLEKEFLTQKSEEILQPTLNCLANEFLNKFSCHSDYSDDPTQFEPRCWQTEDVWINFQKKCEFNPIHSHSGKLSFVLWVQIPYDLKDELSLSNSVNSNMPLNSLFQFISTDLLGNITTEEIFVNKSYEGTIIVFPSSLNHQVYPFYTSDDYRISISGNLRLVEKPTSISQISYH